MKTDNTELFERMPVSKAVLSMVVPAVLSHMIGVFYNMADTFFIGQLGDPNQVAAATLAMPMFMFMTGISNLFGIGGSSLISRSLGAGNGKKARQTASFCMYTGAVVAVIYGLLMLFLKPVILPVLGANEGTLKYCTEYLIWTVNIGALPTILSAMLSHLVRSEGYSREASIGVALGGILNIILDPIFIFAFRLQIIGAAVATMLSNVAALAYFAVLIYKKRKSTVILPDPRQYSVRDKIPLEVITVGLTSFCMAVVGTASNMVLNRIISAYSNEALAGMGVAKKLDMVGYAISQGMTLGVLPLIAYNYASGNHKRMSSAIKKTILYSMIVSIAAMLILIICADPVVKLFIKNDETVRHGTKYMKIIAVACPLTTLNCIAITVFQAMGKKIQPLFLSLIRRGLSDIPFMFLYNAVVGVMGIAWATPSAEIVGLIFSAIFLIRLWKKLFTPQLKGERLPQ